MNTLAPAAPRPPIRRVLGWALIPVALVGLAAWGLTSYIRLGSDARALRNSVFAELQAGAVSWHQKVEASVGPVTLWAVRAGLSFIRMPDEARTALAAARGAEVGVYELSRDASESEGGRILGAADKAMTARGWDRIVSVTRDDGCVAVYAPRSASGGLEACVAVLNGRNLVIAKASGELEPLLKLIDGTEPNWTKVLARLPGGEERERVHRGHRG